MNVSNSIGRGPNTCVACVETLVGLRRQLCAGPSLIAIVNVGTPNISADLARTLLRSRGKISGATLTCAAAALLGCPEATDDERVKPAERDEGPERDPAAVLVDLVDKRRLSRSERERD